MKNLAPVFGLIFGLLLSCLLALFFKEQPLHVLKVLLSSFSASSFDFGLTLFYTTCFIFSGLAFTLPLKAGIFHIGAEGQIIASALTAALIGSSFNETFLGLSTEYGLGFALSLILVFLGTFAVGILAALIIVLFRKWRQAHEVVVAIMLNFIFAALATWLATQKFQNPESQNPETRLITPSLQFLKTDFLKTYFDLSPVSVFFIVAVLSCFILAFLEKKTLLAYQIKAYGQNPQATQRLGINETKILMITLGLAGFFSSLVGLTEVLGNTFQFKVGFSPQYGFLGIAVALLARQNFLGLIASAFLMACLHKGASDLDLETQYLTRDFSMVLQALIIFSVAASYSLFQFKFKKSIKASAS